MKTCIDKVCEGVLCDDECKDLKPSICGKNRELFAPENACGSIRIEGADDVEINQGVCIDLTEGVHAYDGNGREIEYEVEPSEIGCCDVGEHEVTYTAIGSSKEMIPYIRTSKPMLGFNACGLVVKKVKRLVTILQALPPTIIGAVRTVLPIGASFDPMYGVSGIDDNGNATEVTFEGNYDVATDEADIVTFDSDVVQDLRSVKVSLEPIQNCTPWIGTEENNTPYLMRSVESIGMDVGNTQHDEIVGATVGWNQLIQNGNFADASVWTKHNEWGISNNKATFTASASAFYSIYQRIDVKANHKYFVGVTVSGYSATGNPYEDRISLDPTFGNYPSVLKDIASNGRYEGIREVDDTASWYMGIKIQLGANQSLTQSISDFVCIDLTATFGTAIADYAYSLEQAHAGDGVAWFRKLFDKPYYPYNSGELMSVKPSAHEVVGFNQWDGTFSEVGKYLKSDGTTANSSGFNITNYIRALPNIAYSFHNLNSAASGACICWYDSDKRFISSRTLGGAQFTDTSPSNAMYLRCTLSPSMSNICVNISDTNRNGEYEPYVKNSYPLDDSTEYRGLFKLDANNNLYADGDVYKSHGEVTRRYATMVLDGDEAWTKSTIGQNNYWTHLPSMKSYGGVIVSLGYPQTPTLSIFRDNFGYVYMDNNFCINIDPSICGSDATQFKTWLAQHPITVVYELATPTAGQATPYESSQAIYEGGTEEYIDTRDAPIPVGHETRYALVCPIYGYDSVEVTMVGKNLFGGTALRDGLLGIPNATDHASDGYVSYWANTQAEHNITDGMTFKENTQYTFIYKMYRGSATGSGLRLYYKDGTYVSMPSPSENYGTEQLIITSAEGKTVDRLAYYKDNGSVRIYYNESGIFEGDLELEDFEPYQADTYTSPLPQTVYGGTLDVVSGVLTIDRAIIGGSDWYQYASNNGYKAYRTLTFPFAKANSASGIGAMSNVISEYGSFNSSSMTKNIIQPPSTTYGTCFMALDENIDASTVYFSYLVAEPTTIQLTPQEVKSLIGENNVWSEDGKVQVVYSTPLEDGLSQFDYEGVYPITYHTEDSCGNETDVTRYVIVGDNISIEDTYGIACQGKACYSIIECDENQ